MTYNCCSLYQIQLTAPLHLYLQISPSKPPNPLLQLCLLTIIQHDCLPYNHLSRASPHKPRSLYPCCGLEDVSILNGLITFLLQQHFPVCHICLGDIILCISTGRCHHMVQSSLATRVLIASYSSNFTGKNHCGSHFSRVGSILSNISLSNDTCIAAIAIQEVVY